MFYTGMNFISSVFGNSNKIIKEFQKIINKDINIDNMLEKALNDELIIEPYTFNDNIKTSEEHIDSNLDTHNTVMFLTHSYDVIELMTKLAKKYKTPLIYDFYEELNGTITKYYINSKGEIKIWDYSTKYDLIEKSISGKEKDPELFIEYMNKDIYENIEISDLIKLVKKDKHLQDFLSKNDYNLFKKEKNILIIRLIDSFAVDGLLTYENDGLEIENDTRFNYMRINLLEFL